MHHYTFSWALLSFPDFVSVQKEESVRTGIWWWTTNHTEHCVLEACLWSHFSLGNAYIYYDFCLKKLLINS